MKADNIRRNRSKGAETITSIESLAPWTTFEDLAGSDRSGFKTVATLIGRAQIHDRKKVRANEWDAYPTNRVAWVGYGSKIGLRFLGVGDKASSPDNVLPAERVFQVKLPFLGCGRDLAEALGIYHLHSELLEQHGRNTGAVDSKVITRFRKAV